MPKGILKKSPGAYWITQSILLLPLFLLWLGLSYWYLNKSGYLLKTFFGEGLGGLVVIAFGVVSIILGIAHLAKTPADKLLDWMASVVLCLFATFTLIALFGQMVN